MASTSEATEKRLSRREREVAALVAEGLTNREIAQRLFISERTVDGHLEHVREKLGVTTRAQVAAWVVRLENAAPVTAPVISPKPPRPRLVAHPRLWLATSLVLALLAAGVGLLLLTAPSGPTIETIAGIEPLKEGDVGGNSGNFGPAKSAQLSRPSDVVAAADGTIYIADYGNVQIRRVDSNGMITTVAGGGKEPLTDGAFAANVKLRSPSSLALDTAEQLYILETRNDHLEVWTLRDFSLWRVADLGRSRAAQPFVFQAPIGGLAFGPDETLYISDRAQNHVWRMKPNGRPEIYAGSGVAGYTGDLGAATEARLWEPMGLAVDKEGNLYIADAGNNVIRKVDVSGVITTVGTGSTTLSIPFGVAVGGDGTIYVADTGNNRVLKISPAGRCEVVAGSGEAGFWGDTGPALQAQLNVPEAVAVAGRDLLVADAGNHRIRAVRFPK